MIDCIVVLVTFSGARNGRLEFLKSNGNCASYEKVPVCLNGRVSDKLL